MFVIGGGEADADLVDEVAAGLDLAAKVRAKLLEADADRHVAMAFFLGAALLMVMLDAGPGGDAIGTIEITDGKAEIAPVAAERDARSQRLGLGRRIGNAALEFGESSRVGGLLETGHASCRERVCQYGTIS